LGTPGLKEKSSSSAFASRGTIDIAFKLLKVNTDSTQLVEQAKKLQRLSELVVKRNSSKKNKHMTTK